MTDTPWYVSALENGSRRHAPTWSHEGDGDLLAGRIVARSTTNASRFHPHGVPYLVVKIEKCVENGYDVPAGEWRKLLCSRAALAEMLNEENPQPGDQIAVSYHGEEQFPDGTRRHTYRIAVVPGGQAESLAQAAAEAATPW